MHFFEFWNLFAAIAFVAALAIMPIKAALTAERAPASEKESAEDGTEPGSGELLSANEYFTMAPFVVPVVEEGQHTKQFVLIVAIELDDEDDREDLRRLSPRMRNEIYDLLFKVVSFRTIEPRIPRNEVLRTKLTRIAQRVAGAKMVKSIRVHSAQVRDIH